MLKLVPHIIQLCPNIKQKESQGLVGNKGKSEDQRTTEKGCQDQ